MIADESGLVELAFYAGWVEAFGMSFDYEELCAMRKCLTDSVAGIVRSYLESVRQED